MSASDEPTRGRLLDADASRYDATSPLIILEPA